MTLFKNLTAALLVTAVAAPVMAADEAYDWAEDASKDKRKALRASVRGTGEGQFGDVQERDYSKAAVWDVLGISRVDGSTWKVTVDANHLKTYLTSKRLAATKDKPNAIRVNAFLKQVYGPILNRFGGDAIAAVTFMEGKDPIVVNVPAAGIDTALTPASLEAVQAATADIAPKPKYDAALDGWMTATGPLADKGRFVKGDAVDTILTAKQLADEGLTDLTNVRRVGRRGGEVAYKPFETFKELSDRRTPRVGLGKALVRSGLVEEARVDEAMKDYKFLKGLPIGGDSSLGVVSQFVEDEGYEPLTDASQVKRYVQGLKDQNAALALKLQDMQKLIGEFELQLSQRSQAPAAAEISGASGSLKRAPGASSKSALPTLSAASDDFAF